MCLYNAAQWFSCNNFHDTKHRWNVPVALPESGRQRQRRKQTRKSNQKILIQNHDTTMFEARILQGSVIKKIIEAIRELVTDANLDCNEEQGISIQVSKFDS